MIYCNARKIIVFLITSLFFLILIGCNPKKPLFSNQPSLEPSETYTHITYPAPQLSTRTLSLNSTPVPPIKNTPSQITATSNPSPTITPTVELPSQKPFLVIYQGENTFAIYGSNRHGRRYIQLPNISEFGIHYKPTSLISPNGKWIAFFRGDTNDPTNLTLCLFNIEDGSVIQLTKLYSNDYVDRLDDLATKIPTLFPNRYRPDEDISSLLSNDIRYNLLHLAWSPNNQYLAFAALLDGLSSDLYIYDLNTKEIKRLTSDAENVASIEWSPDSKYILYENSRPDEVYNPTSLLVTKPERTLPKKFKGVVEQPVIEKSWWGKEGWISPNLFMTFISGGDTAPKARLGYRNLDTGEKKIIWKDIYDYYAADTDYKLIALSTQPSIFGSDDPALGRPTDGLYLISLDGKYIKLSDSILQNLVFRGGKFSRFVGEDQQGQIIAISNTGTVKVIGNRLNSHFWISPDRQLLAVQNGEGIDIFDQEDHLTKTIPINNLSGMVWGKDAKSIFYAVNEKYLFFLPIQTGSPILIDDCSLADCSIRLDNPVWIP